MISPLPCLDTSSACVQQLQGLAVSNSPINSKIGESIEMIEEKINEATASNKQSIQLAIFEPALQYFLRQNSAPVVTGQTTGQTGQTVTTQSGGGFVNNVLSIFTRPVGLVNDLLNVIGLPLFRSFSGGNQEQKQAAIAISDLRVKVEELRKSKEEIAIKTRDSVLFSVLEFDVRAREFQIQQAITKRETQRFELFKVGYRFGQSSTEAYLAQQSAIDRQRGAVLREWSQMRSQLEKIKLIVLAQKEEGEE